MSVDERNDCGCCAGISVDTPVTIENRPGLSAIIYRAGTYLSFRQSLLARLSDSRWPVLRSLRSRDDDDFTIALLDAWAVTGDILTFYQERIANESYLRTAKERLSILEQSRLIGYQLRPGVAATTHVAFTMENAPGAPEQAAQPIVLAPGIKVQSIPGPDELPQIFETVEEIEARSEWNALLPQLTETQELIWNMTSLWLEGTTLTLAVGDVLLIVVENAGTFEASLRRVTRVEPDAGLGSTDVSLVDISTSAGTIAATQPGVYVMRTTTAPFGHNAPMKPSFDDDGNYVPVEWDLDDEEDDFVLLLASKQDKVFPKSWLVVEQDDPDTTNERVWIFSKVSTVSHRSVARYGIAGSVTRVGLETPWLRSPDSKLALLQSMTIFAQNEELSVAELSLSYPVYGTTVALNEIAEGLTSGRSIAISGKRQTIRIKHPRPVFGRSSRVPLPSNTPPPTLVLDQGGSVVLAPGDVLWMMGQPSKQVGLSFVPLTPVEFGDVLEDFVGVMLQLPLMDRDGQTGLLEISSTDLELIPSTDDSETVHEIVFIDDNPDTAVTQDRDRTTLQLASSLANVYDRATVRINANVAAATHGESVKEPLGSGDAIPYQRFTLKQPPLTYVSADTPDGSASTLKVYVNDILWQEVPFFYGHGPTERIYVTHRSDDGRTTIRFGDGITGARLPTGQNNVRAEYRKGTGLGGLVKAGQLSLLMSRPLGLKEAVNPEPAAGAEDPEMRDEARRNAPLTVLTLDRAISLQDYEDFSRTFSGIAKAQAVWVWDGRKRSIFLTVAGPDGEVLEEDGATMQALMDSLRTYGDPFAPFTVKSFRPAYFQMQGTITIHPDHVVDTVTAAVTADLQQRYAFASRELGQPVAMSEAIAAVQGITGVVAVDLDLFARNDSLVPPIQARLIADRPAMGADGLVSAAELLMIDGSSLVQLKGVQ